MLLNFLEILKVHLNATNNHFHDDFLEIVKRTGRRKDYTGYVFEEDKLKMLFVLVTIKMQ